MSERILLCDQEIENTDAKAIFESVIGKPIDECIEEFKVREDMSSLCEFIKDTTNDLRSKLDGSFFDISRSVRSLKSLSILAMAAINGVRGIGTFFFR